ncbi:MAG: nickel-dependent hydrogenase large subunit [Jatrophihabitantaceae bacterium]
MTEQTRRLQVQALARVEGEGALDVLIEGGQARSAHLRIYEPPRFFEAFLRSRQHTEVPDLTSRICGICPVAYQASAWQAIEDACGVPVAEPINAIRRLLYCGEWISSHALHIYLLHAPDFLGAADAIELAGRQRAVIERGLALKKAGNAILETVGGRAIHPVNTRLGGFYRAPRAAELTALAEQLRPALDAALATVQWVAGFEFPDVELDIELLAVHRDAEYAIERGEIRTAGGLRLAAAEFSEHVVERQVPHSTALQATLDGARYLTGPLARYTINYQQLSEIARQAATAAGLGPSCRNPYRSIVVRAVETVYAVDEALRLIAGYQRPEPAAVDVPARAGVGHGISEAPRGLLYHRYRLDADGLVTNAVIVPPTSQNQAAIEHDLLQVVAGNLDLDDAALTGLCERTIRNYDPCISCAAHFLQLRITGR